MLTCNQVKQEFISYITGELSVSRRRLVESHLSKCEQCQEDLQDFRRLWFQMDGWDNQPVPKALASSIVAMGKEIVHTQPSNVLPQAKKELSGLLKPLAPLFLGLLAALISSGIVSTRINLSLLHPLELTAVGSLWTLLYTIVFSVLLYGSKSGGLTSSRSFAKASLVAIGIFSLFTIISPVPHSIHFCRYYSVTQPIFERLSVGGSFFVFGLLYALIPMGVAAYLSGGAQGRHFLTRGSLAGLLFILLIAPGIYLQCAPFTIGVLLIWFSGTVIGSVAGGIVGYIVRYRFA